MSPPEPARRGPNLPLPFARSSPGGGSPSARVLGCALPGLDLGFLRAFASP